MADDSLYTPQIITQADLKQADGTPTTPDDPSYAHRILAEGDSWFSIGAVPSSNLLFELELPGKTIILNLAYPGDTVEHMSSLVGNPDFRRLIHDLRYGYAWDLIMLSAGGNDVIDHAEAIIRKPRKASARKPVDFVDSAELARILGEVQAGLPPADGDTRRAGMRQQRQAHGRAYLRLRDAEKRAGALCVRRHRGAVAVSGVRPARDFGQDAGGGQRVPDRPARGSDPRAQPRARRLA